MRKTNSLRRRAYNSSDRRLRWEIFCRLADPQIEGKILVENMDKVFNWVKGGGSLELAKKDGPKLAVVRGK